MGSALPRVLGWPDIWIGRGTHRVAREASAALCPHKLARREFPVARERFAFIEWFDGVLVSGEVGVTKPDPAIFELLCRRFDLHPERTLFVDDTNRHVEAARELGFKTIRFSDPDQLRAELVELGVLGATTE